MEIFLLRHGHSESYAARDSERQLSSQGRSDLDAVLASVQDQLKQVEAVWYSPFVRTHQTKDIVQLHLSHVHADHYYVHQQLVPDSNYRALYDWMAQLQQQSILLVTHQPLIGTLLDDFCGFEAGRYRMGTSAIAAIDTDLPASGLGCLRWIKQPT